MTKRRWLPLILLGIGLMLAQVASAVGRQMGANWMAYLPPVALGLAMIPWAVGIDKLGRTLSLIAAVVSIGVAILSGLFTWGWMRVPSAALAAFAGWTGLRDAKPGE